MKLKVITFVSIVLLLMTTTSCKTQNFAGDWSGRIPQGGGSLGLVLHLQKSGDSWQGTLDSPDQKAFGIPLSSVEIIGDSLSIGVQDLLLSFRGTLRDNAIQGLFLQGRFGTDMVLYRGLEAAEPDRPQTPKPPYPYHVEEVKIPHATESFTIAGTLTTPENSVRPKGVVILISGSGQQDRDETIFGHKPFAVIADHLTRNGYAVLRCDDRGFGESAGDATKATTETLAGDIESEVSFIRRHYPQLGQKVFLLGHSEGGIIAPMVARHVGVSGLVLVSSPTIKGAEVLLSQNAKIDELSMGQSQSSEKQKALKELINIAVGPGSSAELKNKIENYCRTQASVLFPQATTNEAKEQGVKIMTEQLGNPWMKHFLSYDPAPLYDVQKVGEGSPLPPTMAVYGGEDVQVLQELNMPKMKSLLRVDDPNTKNKVLYLPLMNHIMQPAERGTIQEYSFLKMTVMPELLEEIVKFLDTL